MVNVKSYCMDKNLYINNYFMSHKYSAGGWIHIFLHKIE